MRTTTEPEKWGFIFTITDLGKMLGKSPVTLRGWERQKFIAIPRDKSGDRKLTIEDIRGIAEIAFKAKRITEWRYRVINSTLTLLYTLEWMNGQ